MTFLGLASTDYPAIARAEAVRRARAAEGKSDITPAQRRADARTWEGIVRRANYFHADRRALPFGNEVMAGTRELASAVQRTTTAALRKWREAGKPPGEIEARAFLLFHLARKFAELLGDPTPYVDADGTIYFTDQERTAA